MTDQTDFRAIVRDAMKAGGVTQVELARRVGTTQPHLSCWLAGLHDMGADRVAAIMAALDVTIRARSRPARRT